MDETKPAAPSGIMAKLDSALPRMWKEWLITALLIVVLLFFVGSAIDRVGVIIGKVPLLTIGGLLGYYGDRGLFPYARPGDLQNAWIDARNAGFAAFPESEIALLANAFNTACIRRAIIVAACVLGAALAA